MKECDVVVPCKSIVVLLPQQSIAYIGRYYISCTFLEEQSIKVIFEEELKWENLQSIKQTDETRKNAIKAVYSNPVLKMGLKR